MHVKQGEMQINHEVKDQGTGRVSSETLIRLEFKHEDARVLVCYSYKFGISSLSQPPQRLYLSSISDATMMAAEY